MDSIANILKGFGVTQATSAATAKALISPSLENIEAAKAAFKAEGTTIPPEVLNMLMERYYSAIGANPAAYSNVALSKVTDLLPWVLFGTIAVVLISKTRSKS